MKLIFVYNANSGLMNTLMDIGHKAISPQTYECNLCGLTFGIVSEHKQWKQFREASKAEMEFLHRDEFEQKYGQKFEYPVVLQADDNLRVAIAKTELNEIKTLDELIAQVEALSS
ncbi:MAG: GTPase [Cyanobacteria bacterium J06600_6]